MLHIEDSNGHTQTVCVGVLLDETAASLKWLLSKFKELFPAWNNIRCFMADKDLLERDLLKEYFPNAKVLICSFHTLRTFRREIACSKMNITSSERDHALNLLQQMVMTRSEEIFQALENEFDATVPAAIKEYYDRNWRSIKDEWHRGPKFMANSFNNTTNNRLVSVNGKLKSAIKRHSCLEDFVTSLFAVLKASGDEHSQSAVRCAYRRPCVPHGEEAGRQYQEALTPYAFQFVEKQLKAVSKLKILKHEGVKFVFESSCGNTETTADHCSCSFWLSMHLPCKHVLGARRHLDMNEYDDTLYAARWSKAYYHTHHGFFHEAGEKQEVRSSVSSIQRTRPHALSAAQKYRAVFHTCKYLAQLAAEETGNRFQARAEILVKLSKAWEEGIDVEVVELLADNVPRGGIITSTDGSTKGKDCSSQDSHDPSQRIASDDGHVSPSQHVPDEDPTSVETREPGAATEESNEPSTSYESRASPNKWAAPTDSSSLTQQRSDSRLTNAAELGKGSGGDKDGDPRGPQLSAIQIPSKIKHRGRPKGAESTVIGLPRKKKKIQSKQLMPFKNLADAEKKMRILKCFVSEELASRALQGKTLLGRYHTPETRAFCTFKCCE